MKIIKFLREVLEEVKEDRRILEERKREHAAWDEKQTKQREAWIKAGKPSDWKWEL